MPRRVFLQLASDTTETSCGSCPQRYVYGYEVDGYACTAFVGRMFGRDGYRRLPDCVEAERAFEAALREERIATLRGAIAGAYYEAGTLLERSTRTDDCWSAYAIEAVTIAKVLGAQLRKIEEGM